MTSLLSIPVSEIAVPEYRQRTTPLDKAKIVELAESFKRGKQIHPIVLRRETADGPWLLVAGFRRLCTRKLVPTHMMRCGTLSIEAGHIAATDWGTLSETERRELELDENILRVDLTIAEKAAAIGDLHRVREAQARERGEIYTVAQLADDARVAPDRASARDRVNETSLMLTLSKYVADPQVAKIKTIAEARSFLQKRMSAERNTVLRAAYEAASTKGSSNRLLFGNSYDPAIIEQLPAGQFDVACFDPPYGINAHAFGEQGGDSPANAGHLYADTPELFDEVCNKVPLLLDKLLRPEAHVYSFCSAEPERFLQLKAAFEFAGFKVWPRPLIWTKNGRGIAPVPTGGPRYTYEIVLFASRGGKQVEVLANDVLQHSPVPTPRHGAEKPVSLLIDLLMRSVRPGNLILDLFAGSGSIFPAANATHSIAWGVEREQQYYDLALTRLTEKPGDLPAANGTGDTSPLEEI